MKADAKELDRIAEYKNPKDKRERFPSTKQALDNLIDVMGQLLRFLDDRLKRTINELEAEIEKTRSNPVTPQT